MPEHAAPLLVPIVGNPECFLGMPREAVEPALATELLSRDRTTRSEPLVFRLEAYLRVTGQTLALEELGTEGWASKWREFAGALGSRRFHSTDGYRFFSQARTVLASLGDVSTFQDWNYPAPGSTQTSDEFKAAVQTFDKAALDPTQVELWQGWCFRNKKGARISLRLHGMHRRLGPAFVREFASACQIFIRGRALQRVPGVSELSDYIQAFPNELSSEHFLDPTKLGNFLGQFMVWFFRTAHAKGVDPKTIAAQWQVFANFLKTQLLGHSWSEPLRAIPRPRVPAGDGQSTNVRKTASGHLVKFKLITEIPLTVTDEVAVNLLWREIRADVDALELWATEERHQAWKRHLNRKALASAGHAGEIGPTGFNSGNGWRVDRENPEHLANAAATFEQRGIEPQSEGEATLHLIYPRPLTSLAFELGLPNQLVMHAYATLLVLRHPAITPSFLMGLELYDKHGKLKCFFKRDQYWYLEGYKHRKGAAKALQTIKLTSETKELVEEIVALTEPARAYFKARGDHRSDLLFHTFSSMGAVPSQMPFTDSGPIRPALVEGLTKAAGLEHEDATDLARRFTLPRLRASCGVLVYLETQSVQRMAEALGHTTYSPKLLGHYLPSVLQEFFMDRWIRLFQTGIVCEIMKDSHLIWEATGFTPPKLNEFLENHAIKHIPIHLLDPDGEQQHGAAVDTADTRVIFSISEFTLTLLLGLQLAVVQATTVPSGMALRWAAIADKLIPHLEADDLFRPILLQARTNLPSSTVDFLELIRA